MITTKNAALSDQLKQYEIPARRGIIKAHDGDQILPIVLNQKLYTLYADPTYVKNPDGVAQKLGPIVGNKTDYATLLKTKKTRYVVLAKKISEQQSQQILALKFPGVGTIAQDYRTYPQGSLAAQLLGFVDDGGSAAIWYRASSERSAERQARPTPRPSPMPTGCHWPPARIIPKQRPKMAKIRC